MQIYPVGKGNYIVVKKGEVVRTAKVQGAKAAYETLKPKRGEKLYIEVRKL